MVNSLLATKLYIPPLRTKVVFRPQLTDRLNAGLHRKLTLIAAPAGFGKTTLVSAWLASCERPAAWLSLDDGDSDPTRFLTYLVAALQTIAPTIGAGVLGVLQSSQPPSPKSILTALLNDIAAVPDAFILVLDDYHLIDAQPIDDALTFLLEHMPPQLHLVITTREDPQLPVVRLRVRDQMTELRAADLRFTPAEAAEFLNTTMGLNLSIENISALEARTEGWIAGLQLAAISMQGYQEATSFIKSFTGTHHFVLDYLVEEVLHQQSERVQNFLLRTSILNRMCGPLCDAVLLDTSASGQKTLEDIEHANLFIIPLDNERRWYRYHHLFGSLLRQRLAQSKTPEEIAHYHLRASAWYEKNGDGAEAFHHAITARDFSRAAALAEITWQTMYDSFQPSTWLGWVKQLPEEILCSRPVLCTQIAWGWMNAHEVDASESRLRDAERCLDGSSDGMVIVDTEQFRSLHARIAFARAYNAQTRRDFRSSLQYAELVLTLIPDENQLLRAQTTAILGATYLINGDLNAACQSMSDWIDSSLKAGDFFSAIAYAMAEKADILTAQGYLREALRTYQQSLVLASEHESVVQRVLAHHYLGMAMLYHEMGDAEAADQHLQKSLELGSLHMSVDWSYRRCIAQARLKESAGELEAAIDLLDEAKRFYIKTLIPHTRPIDALKARIYLKQGRLFKAEEWVNEQRLSVDDELMYLREFEHITLARVLLTRSKSDPADYSMHEAVGLLERLLQAAEARKRTSSVIEILVLQALAHQAQGDISAALIPLRQALTLAEPESYVRMFVDEGPPMKVLIADCRLPITGSAHGESNRHSGTLLAYISKLLGAFPDSGAHVGNERATKNQSEISNRKPAMVEPLSVRERDVLRLLRTDLSGPEIARKLMVSLNTLRTHTNNIYDKLGVNNRRAAVRRAEALDLF